MYKEEQKIKRKMSTANWRKNNPEKVREYNRIHEQSDSTKKYRKEYSKRFGAVKSKRWRDNNKEKSRDTSLRYTYGIGVEQYNQMFVNQNGVCAICKNTQQSGQNLSVDHNHGTGEIRGLLCRSCNAGLGHFYDDISKLLKAVEYLNNSNK